MADAGTDRAIAQGVPRRPARAAQRLHACKAHAWPLAQMLLRAPAIIRLRRGAGADLSTGARLPHAWRKCAPPSPTYLSTVARRPTAVALRYRKYRGVT